MFQQKDLCQLANRKSFFEFSFLDFEYCCKYLLEKAGGFQCIQVTDKGPKGGDGGVDLVIRSFSQKIVAYGQCKQWQTRYKSLVPAIRELCGCMARDGVSKGFLITTIEANDFEKEEARQCHVEIIDINVLEKLLVALTPKMQTERSNCNFKKYRTGRLATDYVTDIRGQMSTCVVCGLEYSMEDAMTKKWPLYGGHCERCSTEKTQ